MAFRPDRSRRQNCVNVIHSNMNTFSNETQNTSAEDRTFKSTPPLSIYNFRRLRHVAVTRFAPFKLEFTRQDPGILTAVGERPLKRVPLAGRSGQEIGKWNGRAT